MIRIPNIENYTLEIINGELICNPKCVYITENELYNTDLSHSKIEKCLIKKDDEIISSKIGYKPVLVDIWKQMPTQKILQTTTFNFKLTDEKGIYGYYWCEEVKCK
jgi:hypothetical protein